MYNFDFEKFNDLFNKKYEFIYNNYDRVEGYKKAVANFDKILKEKTEYYNFICDFVKYRQDPISSDREAAAFMFALNEYNTPKFYKIHNVSSKFSGGSFSIYENKIFLLYGNDEKTMKIKIEYGYIYKLLKTMIKTDDPERLYKYLVDCYNNDFCVCLADKVLNHILKNGK